MVKPITIKLEENLWNEFKKLAKVRGLTLEAALEEAFTSACDKPARRIVPATTEGEPNVN